MKHFLVGSMLKDQPRKNSKPRTDRRAKISSRKIWNLMRKRERTASNLVRKRKEVKKTINLMWTERQSISLWKTRNLVRKRKRTTSNLVRKRKEVKKKLQTSCEQRGRALICEKPEISCERGKEQLQISCEREKKSKNSKPRANKGIKH